MAAPRPLEVELPPDVLAQLYAGLIRALGSGVTQVDYADRSVKYQSVGDILKALDRVGGLILPGGGRRRYLASFNKGLVGGAPCGPEHAELPGVDVLFSRGVEADPTRTEDVDWERAR